MKMPASVNKIFTLLLALTLTTIILFSATPVLANDANTGSAEKDCYCY